jgi:hypothetical protein
VAATGLSSRVIRYYRKGARRPSPEVKVVLIRAARSWARCVLRRKQPTAEERAAAEMLIQTVDQQAPGPVAEPRRRVQPRRRGRRAVAGAEGLGAVRVPWATESRGNPQGLSPITTESQAETRLNSCRELCSGGILKGILLGILLGILKGNLRRGRRIRRAVWRHGGGPPASMSDGGRWPWPDP